MSWTPYCGQRTLCCERACICSLLGKDGKERRGLGRPTVMIHNRMQCWTAFWPLLGHFCMISTCGVETHFAQLSLSQTGFPFWTGHFWLFSEHQNGNAKRYHRNASIQSKTGIVSAKQNGCESLFPAKLEPENLLSLQKNKMDGGRLTTQKFTGTLVVSKAPKKESSPFTKQTELKINFHFSLARSKN